MGVDKIVCTNFRFDSAIFAHSIKILNCAFKEFRNQGF